MENLLMRKYQLGCPAHSTSSGSRQIERKLDLFALQFIHDAAVVDAAHRNFAAVFLIEQAFAAFLQLENVDDRDAQIALREQKVAAASSASPDRSPAG